MPAVSTMFLSLTKWFRTLSQNPAGNMTNMIYTARHILKTGAVPYLFFCFRQRFLEFPTWFEKVKSGDMALFSIISAKGKLRLIDGIMAVYRKNERGVTSGQKIIDYHKNRIRLMRFFKAHFGVYQTHLNEIIGPSSQRNYKDI
jgi:hypothetical protein